MVIARLSSLDEASRVQDEVIILIQVPSLPDLHVISKKRVSMISCKTPAVFITRLQMISKERQQLEQKAELIWGQTDLEFRDQLTG